MNIAIDCGHCISGADTGAGANGFREEILTREVGNEVATLFRSLGHTVTFIHCDTANSVRDSLNSRVRNANSTNYDIVISIHFNAGGGRGVEIYVDGYCNNMATDVLNQILKLNFNNRGLKNGMDLALVGSVENKAMLIECCFIDTDDMDKFNAKKMAQAIVKGLDDKFKIPEDTGLHYKEDVIEVISFNEEFYLKNNPDVKAAVDKKYFVSGYDHYVKAGKKEGRKPLPTLPPNFTNVGYILCNEDVLNAINKGLYASGTDHYLKYGWKENRKYIYQQDVNEKIKEENVELKKKIEKVKEIVK